MKSPSAPSVTPRNPNDLFSAQVDRVFEREERKSQRISYIPPNVLAELSAADVSRNNSWSSVDSAVVMGETPRDVPSRHSSWGSGDNNRNTPSRNSSWGSYDMRNATISNADPGNNRLQQQQPAAVTATTTDKEKEKEDVPWTISGTVKRTKQKIEEQASSVVKRICSGDALATSTNQRPKRNNARNRCSSEEVLSSTNLDSNFYRIGRLSASAPETVSVGFLSTSPAFRQSKAFGSVDETDELTQQQQQKQTKTGSSNNGKSSRHAGMVKNLKMNFEAKVQAPTTMTQSVDNNTSGNNSQYTTANKKGRSLPSSPVHTDPNQNKSPLRETIKQQQEENTLEDINVRNLVDRYEETKKRSHTTPAYRNSFPASKRNSSIDIPPSQQQPRHITRQRPMSVLETTRLNINNTTTATPTATANTKPLMINHATIFLKDEPRRPPMPKSGSTTGKSFSILNKTNNNNNNNNGGAGNQGGGGCKKFLQHGRTHPLAKLEKQKLNTATPYNTM